MNSLDVALGLILALTFISGFRRGFLSSLLATIGYVGGGLLGLEIAITFTSGWSNPTKIVALFLLAIFIGSALLRWVFEKIGKSVHKRILFGPFKSIDSILGGLLSAALFLLFVYVISTLLLYAPWQKPKVYINESVIYEKLTKVNLHSFHFEDLLKSTLLHLDQLK